MLAIAGTVPDRDFPLVAGKVRLKDEVIYVQGKKFPVNRGTPALLASAIKTCELLDIPGPFGYLAGDIGQGYGSRCLYEHLTRVLKKTGHNTFTFHYLQPDVDWHNLVMFALEEMRKRPVLIADAGFMYAAKMSGQSCKYDLFTPDIGELAFLADEEAPHPFYTRGFILHEENRVPDLISRAYQHQNAARCLLVKGRKDYVADSEGIRAVVDHPSEEAMEAMGGTGDTITGIVAALIESGMTVHEAATAAIRANRLAGSYAEPTPATQIKDIVRYIPGALEKILYKK
ncbi:MAG: NAD(P)H-hydrate dehydratase [Thermodesulfobacteriota bacterium]